MFNHRQHTQQHLICCLVVGEPLIGGVLPFVESTLFVVVVVWTVTQSFKKLFSNDRESRGYYNKLHKQHDTENGVVASIS